MFCASGALGGDAAAAFRCALARTPTAIAIAAKSAAVRLDFLSTGELYRRIRASQAIGCGSFETIDTDLTSHLIGISNRL